MSRFYRSITSDTRRRGRAVMIVQTRCDRPGDENICPVPERLIKEAFGRYALVNFSSANNRGRANLLEKLAEFCRYSVLAPRRRDNRRRASSRQNEARSHALRRRVARRSKTQSDIDSGSFRQICADADLKSEPTFFLLDYLHVARSRFF